MQLKKLLPIFLGLMIILGTALQAEAQPRKRNIQRHRAKRYLMRTNKVIFAAKVSVAKNKNYTGDLAKAVRHQRFARRLYLRGRYYRAAAHSRAARIRAIQAIKANKGTLPPEAEFSTEDQQTFSDTSITDQSLEQELDKELPEVIDEEDLIDSDLGLDITD